MLRLLATHRSRKVKKASNEHPTSACMRTAETAPRPRASGAKKRESHVPRVILISRAADQNAVVRQHTAKKRQRQPQKLFREMNPSF